MELRRKRNCRSQALAVGCPSTTGGENSQLLAAWSARSAKYGLDPRVLNVADVTLPEESTSTCTATLMVLLMVLCARLGTSGITRRATAAVLAAGWAGASGVLGSGVGVTRGMSAGGVCGVSAADPVAFFPRE